MLDSASPAAAAAPDKAAILASAKTDYTYEDPPRRPIDLADPSVLPNPGVPVADAPKITISKATRKSIVVMPKDEVLARISSDKAYPGLGIIAGDTYVWRDRSDSNNKKWKVYAVPDDATTKEKKLKRSNKEYSKGSDHAEPRLVRAVRDRALVAFGACLDDPSCSSGHCGYGELELAVRN